MLELTRRKKSFGRLVSRFATFRGANGRAVTRLGIWNVDAEITKPQRVLIFDGWMSPKPNNDALVIRIADEAVRTRCRACDSIERTTKPLSKPGPNAPN